jgi:uncharacterized protein (DUF2132 family)
MDEEHENDPLHGVTLEAMLLSLVEKYGWEELAERIPVKCFSSDPSVKSSLTFLRRTPWARAKVEKLYLGKLRPRRPARKPLPTRGAAAQPTTAQPKAARPAAPKPAAAGPDQKTQAKEGGRRYPGMWVDER